jgi:hypothetical protein
VEPFETFIPPLREEDPGILSRGVIVFHADLHPHLACTINDVLSSMSWTVLDLPPYSLDVSPYYFHVYLPLRKVPKSRSFRSGEDVKTVVV